MAVPAECQIAHALPIQAKPSRHARHRPEQTVLYQVIDQHWSQFLERADEQGGLPKFVEREVEEYLRCGRLEYGCLLLKCQGCGDKQLVAFSCKRRGFCPSCLGRRMTDTALMLVEQVLPPVPVRQWVCSLPFQLRALCGYNKQLCALVIRAFTRELSRSLKHRAKRQLGLSSIRQAHTGSVTFVQRFDSALRLNVHLHVLALDGVYIQDAQGALTFHGLDEPTADEVAEVAQRTARRIRSTMLKLGLRPDPALEQTQGDDQLQLDAISFDDGQDAADAADTEQHPALLACYGAATQGLDLFAQRAGQPSLRLVDPSLARPAEPHAVRSGINVHAKLCIDANDRARLEQLCRYLARPPIAQERLTRLDDGRVRYELKKPWKDGTQSIVLHPLDLIARVIAMIPPPGFHMVRYHGVLSSHSSLRRFVVPAPPPPVANPVAPSTTTGRGQLELSFDGDSTADPTTARRKPWAWLLRYVFLTDVSQCSRCGDRMQWVEVATTAEALNRLLADHDLADSDPTPPVASSLQHAQDLPPEQLRFCFD